jgi:hypothetical protein
MPTLYQGHPCPQLFAKRHQTSIGKDVCKDRLVERKREEDGKREREGKRERKRRERERKRKRVEVKEYKNYTIL